VEYLLSERNEAINNVVYQAASVEKHFSYGLEMGKIRMIDAFLALPDTVKLTLKEEKVQ
jgi:hypothetical protein